MVAMFFADPMHKFFSPTSQNKRSADDADKDKDAGPEAGMMVANATRMTPANPKKIRSSGSPDTVFVSSDSCTASAVAAPATSAAATATAAEMFSQSGGE
jgi:hypothetical protein